MCVWGGARRQHVLEINDKKDHFCTMWKMDQVRKGSEPRQQDQLGNQDNSPGEKLCRPELRTQK